MCMLVWNSRVFLCVRVTLCILCLLVPKHHEVLFRYKHTWQEVGTGQIYSLPCIVHSMWSNYSAVFRLCWKAVKPSCELQHGYNWECICSNPKLWGWQCERTAGIVDSSLLALLTWTVSLASIAVLIVVMLVWMMHSISHPAGEEGCTVFETFDLLEVWGYCVNSN